MTTQIPDTPDNYDQVKLALFTHFTSFESGILIY